MRWIWYCRGCGKCQEEDIPDEDIKRTRIYPDFPSKYTGEKLACGGTGEKCECGGTIYYGVARDGIVYLDEEFSV